MHFGRPYLIAWPLVFFYYKYGTQVLLPVARAAVRRVPWTARNPVLDVENAIRFMLAAVVQLCFCGLLIAIAGADPAYLGFSRFHPILLLFGLVLGLGEMALSSFVCHAGMRAALALWPERVPAGIEQWVALLHAGWMREIKSTINTLPCVVSGGVITLYIAGEEIIFRSVLVGMAVPLGRAAAVATSTVFFSLIQTLHMPSWRSGVFPVVGALITGMIHGTLFLLVPEIWPLIVAHLTLFVAGTL